MFSACECAAVKMKLQQLGRSYFTRVFMNVLNEAFMNVLAVEMLSVHLMRSS